MSREPTQNGNGATVRWEYFVKRDKSASELFDELCRGIAQVIRRLEPFSNYSDLSPNQLSNFYRSCGGNYDELFKNTGEHGLSWIYRTLGCYHSLRPTRNPFESPSIPCLTEDGYVRWQTLQLLLCPQEHSVLIQKAVELYDVPRKAGGFFPKTIPNECFPQKPDVDMEKWHRFVTSQIDQETYMRSLKNSPYTSPQVEGPNSPGGYFVRRPQGRRPSQAPRRNSLSEEELARREAFRRRSSVPDVISPGGKPLADADARRPARSRSANRPVSNGTHHFHPRPNTGIPNRCYTPPRPSHRPADAYPPRQNDSSTSIDRRDRRSDLRHSRTTSSGSRLESSSDASSEESYSDRKHRSGEEDTSRLSRWGASLMPSFFLSKNQRRHSSDGRVPTLANDKRSPRRNESIRKYRTEGSSHPPGRYLDAPPDRTSNGVRFNDVFSPGDAQTPRAEDSIYAPPPSSYRWSESQAGPFVPTNSNTVPTLPNMAQVPPTPPSASALNGMNYFESHPPQPNARKQGLPVRISNVSGVNGRRYPPAEAWPAVEPITRRDRTSSTRTSATSTVL